MTTESKASSGSDWLEACGLCHILRTLGLAVHPAKLGIALGAILVTLLFGALLDFGWSFRGGVDDSAIARFVEARYVGETPEEMPGDSGIFAVWQKHERRCVHGLLTSCIPGIATVIGTPVGTSFMTRARPHAMQHLAGMADGVWWMAKSHPLYFVLFTLGTLLIWSYAGGAICRCAAIQFAHGERLTIKQSLGYARSKLFGGFFLAPCIPLALIAVGAILLVLNGLVLRIPVVGDLVGGIAFGFAILDGFVIAIVLLGLVVGGSLFWPAVAVEGSDAFDAFSRGLSYVFSKPWKTVLYAVLAFVLAGICWVFLNLFTFFALSVARVGVAFGTSPFGAFSRGPEGEHVTKLELLWPVADPTSLYAWPDWSQLAWYECFSAFVITLFVLVVIGLVWSFLASFYFSSSTVIYCLLRRDVDQADLEDVYVEEAEDEFRLGGGAAEPAKESAPTKEVSIPVAGDPPPADVASTSEDKTPDADE